MPDAPEEQSWLNRTILGVGLTSLFSDWSHETATAVLPAFLAAIGAGPMWLGAIEGIADGLSSFAKLAAGHYTDRLKHRKPLAVFGYAFTALATASFAFATHAYHVLFGRVAAWISPARSLGSGCSKQLRILIAKFFSGRFCPASWPSRFSGCSSASGPSQSGPHDPSSSVCKRCRFLSANYSRAWESSARAISRTPC